MNRTAVGTIKLFYDEEDLRPAAVIEHYCEKYAFLWARQIHKNQRSRKVWKKL